MKTLGVQVTTNCILKISSCHSVLMDTVGSEWSSELYLFTGTVTFGVVLMQFVRVASCAVHDKGKSWSVRLTWQTLSCHLPTHRDQQNETLYKHLNILETGFMSAFLAMFNFHFLVSLQWAFPSFWCIQTRMRIERCSHCRVGENLGKGLIEYL